MLLHGSLRQVLPVGLHNRWHQQSHQHRSSSSDSAQTSDSVHAARHPGHGDGVHQRGRSCLDRNSVPTVRMIFVILSYRLKFFNGSQSFLFCTSTWAFWMVSKSEQESEPILYKINHTNKNYRLEAKTDIPYYIYMLAMLQQLTY